MCRQMTLSVLQQHYSGQAPSRAPGPTRLYCLHPQPPFCSLSLRHLSREGRSRVDSPSKGLLFHKRRRGFMILYLNIYKAWRLHWALA
jgi:hypothetical protein